MRPRKVFFIPLFGLGIPCFAQGHIAWDKVPSFQTSGL